jgi:DNA polymerase V
VTIYIRTNKFNKNHLQDRSFATQCLDVPSNYPPDFYEVTMPALTKIFKPGLNYTKAGIFLTDITPSQTIQQHLYESTKNNSIETKQIISSMMDAVRSKYGRNSIKFGSMGVRPNWYAKSSRLSNRYSTKLKELIEAH